MSLRFHTRTATIAIAVILVGAVLLAAPVTAGQPADAGPSSEPDDAGSPSEPDDAGSPSEPDDDGSAAEDGKANQKEGADSQGGAASDDPPGTTNQSPDERATQGAAVTVFNGHPLGSGDAAVGETPAGSPPAAGRIRSHLFRTPFVTGPGGGQKLGHPTMPPFVEPGADPSMPAPGAVQQCDPPADGRATAAARPPRVSPFGLQVANAVTGRVAADDARAVSSIPSGPVSSPRGVDGSASLPVGAEAAGGDPAPDCSDSPSSADAPPSAKPAADSRTDTHRGQGANASSLGTGPGDTRAEDVVSGETDVPSDAPSAVTGDPVAVIGDWFDPPGDAADIVEDSPDTSTDGTDSTSGSTETDDSDTSTADGDTSTADGDTTTADEDTSSVDGDTGEKSGTEQATGSTDGSSSDGTGESQPVADREAFTGGGSMPADDGPSAGGSASGGEDGAASGNAGSDSPSDTPTDGPNEVRDGMPGVNTLGTGTDANSGDGNSTDAGPSTTPKNGTVAGRANGLPGIPGFGLTGDTASVWLGWLLVVLALALLARSHLRGHEPGV